MNRRVPTILFQYTDIYGLKGILDKRKWRATDYRFLNDGKEIIYADDMMSKFLQMRLSKLKSNHILAEIYEEVLGKRYGKSSILAAWDNDIYITSFSEDGNLLDQWRAYAADGAGYAIGINPWRLRYKMVGPNIVTRNENELNFVRVSYDVDEQENLILNLIERAEALFDIEYEQLNNKERKIFPSVAARSLSSLIWQLAMFYKHPAFRNEREWRIVTKRWGRRVMSGVPANALQNVQFRLSHNMLVPYLELDFTSRDNPNLLPLKKIFLGPKHKEVKIKDSLEMYLVTLGYEDEMPDLLISDIPYQ